MEEYELIELFYNIVITGAIFVLILAFFYRMLKEKHAIPHLTTGLIIIFLSLCVLMPGNVFAATAAGIDADVDAKIRLFTDVKGSDRVIKEAEGLLVFPAVFKAGLGFGGEYGEGALRINGKTVDYYSTAAASIGFQLGVQKKTIIIAFMEKRALENFRNSSEDLRRI